MMSNIPFPPQIANLLARFHTPAHVIAHSEAVAQCAEELAGQVPFPVNTKLLLAACRLHDIARTQPNHARAGADILTREGYPDIAALVAVHHDLPENASAEAALLYLADKLVQGTNRVTLAQRFAASYEKCSTPEALAAWQQRRDRAYQALRELQLSLSESEVSHE